MADLGWADRVVDYVTVALLVAWALLVAFLAEDACSLRLRVWLVRCRWSWAARDATATATVAGTTVKLTSTRETALLLLDDVMGDM